MKMRELKMITTDDDAETLEKIAERNIGLAPPDPLPDDQHGPPVFVMLTPSSVIVCDAGFHAKKLDDLDTALAAAVEGALVLDLHEVDRETAQEVGWMYPRLDTRLAPNEYRQALHSLADLTPELLASLKQMARDNGLDPEGKPESLRTNRDRVGVEVWAAFWTEKSSKARVGRVRNKTVVWEQSVRPTQGMAFA